MIICDKCRKEPVAVTLSFKTKSFEICEKCALKIVAWLEKPQFKKQLGEVWERAKNIGGGI